MTKTTRMTLASVLGLSLLLTGIAWAETRDQGLDGSSWKIDVKPDDISKKKGEKDFSETLTFADGKLMTTQAEKMGFFPAPYVLTRVGDKDWSFTSEQQGTSGKYLWTGNVNGDDMKGKLVWTKKDDTALTYSFTGEKKE